MRIGVVITVYNLANYVAEAIESVLGQSHRPDKIIVVNDGSTDNSIDIIKKYSKDVEIIDNPKNLGVLPSVLLALNELDTDIITMLDGDDRWHRDKLIEVKALFESDDQAMFCTHSYSKIDSNGTVIPGSDQTLDNIGRIKRYAKNDINDFDLMLKTSILSYFGVWLGSAWSFRKNCFDQEAFTKFSVSLPGHELSHQDQPLAAYLIMTNPGKRIRYIDKVLFDYRIFGENSSGSSSSVAKALKTLARSKATVVRTYTIVNQMPGRVPELQRQTDKLLEIDYLENLYQGKYRVATGNFFKLFGGFWRGRDRVKELVRFAGVIVFGPDRFLKHK